jgi:hypothetical protein
MVKNDGAQLYTIEGFSAGLIMVMTAYLVVNATSVYTAGDTHINDMQLEALGSDALQMMDVAPNSTDAKTPLQGIIENLDPANRTKFQSVFLSYTNASGSGPKHDIQFNATYTCRNVNVPLNPPTESFPIISTRDLTGGEHTVRATKWVIVDKAVCDEVKQNRAVLVEVLLWRD